MTNAAALHRSTLARALDLADVSASADADLDGNGTGSPDRDSADDPLLFSRDQPVLHAQYFSQALSSGLPLLAASAFEFVAVAFLSGGRQLLFHHAQGNCVKLWRTEWASSRRRVERHRRSFRWRRQYRSTAILSISSRQIMSGQLSESMQLERCPSLSHASFY